MMQKVTRELLKNSSLVCAIRKNGFAAAASSDPIQKLFLDKIKEYAQKSNSAPNGLVDSNQQTVKAMEDELERVRNNYQVKKGEETTITSKFNDADLKYEI